MKQHLPHFVDTKHTTRTHITQGNIIFQPKGHTKNPDMTCLKAQFDKLCMLIRYSDFSVDGIVSLCIHGQLVTNEQLDGNEELTKVYTLHEECKHIKRMIEYVGGY